jgi:hypothetical protein
MSLIQRYRDELSLPERRAVAGFQLATTTILSCMSFASSYVQKPKISPQYILVTGITSLIITHLLDSAVKTYFDTSTHLSNKFKIIKGGLLCGIIGAIGATTAILFKNRNIPLGDNSNMMMGVNMIFVRFMP